MSIIPDMTNGIKFQEEGHLYTIGGIAIPSVTTIISRTSDFSMVNQYDLEHARSRGTDVHFAVEKFIKYDYVSKIDSDAQPYFEQFLQWFEVNKKIRENFACEIIGYHDTFNFCGTIDLIETNENFNNIWDIKTGSTINMKSCTLQLTGYSMICQKHNVRIEKLNIIQLQPDFYKIFPCRFEQGIFLSYLSVYNYETKGD